MTKRMCKKILIQCYAQVYRQLAEEMEWSSKYFTTDVKNFVWLQKTVSRRQKKKHHI